LFFNRNAFNKGSVMAPADFKYLRLSRVGDVVLVEIMCADMQGPQLVKEFIAELTEVVNQEGARPLLVDLRRTSYFSSMGYAALFKVVKQAKERQRPIRFCNMHPDVRPGAEIVGLKLVVEIHDCQKSALDAFVQGEEKAPGEANDSESAPAMYSI
jgi:anti-anti-sigma factor